MAGIVLKMMSKSQCRCRLARGRGSQPRAKAPARSLAERAATVTWAPRAYRLLAKVLPQRPKPRTRQRELWMVTAVFSMATWMAPSAVGMEFKTAISSISAISTKRRLYWAATPRITGRATPIKSGVPPGSRGMTSVRSMTRSSSAMWLTTLPAASVLLMGAITALAPSTACLAWRKWSALVRGPASGKPTRCRSAPKASRAAASSTSRSSQPSILTGVPASCPAMTSPPHRNSLVLYVGEENVF